MAQGRAASAPTSDGELSPVQFPTHSPTVNRGVWAIAQASRRPHDVPVLHAKPSGRAAPKGVPVSASFTR